jgi:hypothetical protein
VALPKIYVENLDIDVPTAMRPAFNMPWNSFGSPRITQPSSQRIGRSMSDYPPRFVGGCSHMSIMPCRSVSFWSGHCLTASS